MWNTYSYNREASTPDLKYSSSFPLYSMLLFSATISPSADAWALFAVREFLFFYSKQICQQEAISSANDFFYTYPDIINCH